MPYISQNVLPRNFQPPGVQGKIPPVRGKAVGLRRNLAKPTGPNIPDAYPTLLPTIDSFSVASVAQPRARMIPSFVPSPRVPGAVMYPVSQSGVMPAGRMGDYRTYKAQSSFAPFSLMDIKPGLGGYRPVGLQNPAGMKGVGCPCGGSGSCGCGMGDVGSFGEITLPLLGSVDVYTLALAGGAFWLAGKLMSSFGGKKRRA